MYYNFPIKIASWLSLSNKKLEDHEYESHVISQNHENFCRNLFLDALWRLFLKIKNDDFDCLVGNNELNICVHSHITVALSAFYFLAYVVDLRRGEFILGKNAMYTC